MSMKHETAQPTHASVGPKGMAATDRAPLSCAAVWQALEKESFAVVSHVSVAGEPRSSGVVYGMVDRRLYVAVAADGWKARQISNGQEVAVTVPVRRGGILSLVMPIPPATITFRATATVHPTGSLDVTSVSKDLAKLVPTNARSRASSSNSHRGAGSSRTASACRSWICATPRLRGAGFSSRNDRPESSKRRGDSGRPNSGHVALSRTWDWGSDENTRPAMRGSASGPSRELKPDAVLGTVEREGGEV
jgi:pyridoxamine 5'-phosphate oxidase-like protein